MAVIVVEPFRGAEDIVVGTITPELRRVSLDVDGEMRVWGTNTADCALMTTADAARMAVVYFILTGR